MLGVIDEPYNTVTIAAGIILLGKIQFGPVVDRLAVRRCDHFHQRTFTVRFFSCRSEDDREFTRGELRQRTDRDDADTSYEEFEEGGIKTLTGLLKHHIQ